MRLICPNCDAQYEVDDGAIPPGGRDVQCSNCGHAWFQMHVDALHEDEAEEFAEAPPAPVAAPAPRPAPATAPVTRSVAEPHPAPAAPPPPAPAPDVVPSATDDGAETAEPPSPPNGPVRRTLDENLLAVLREEAAREAAERRAEAARTIETQPDLGLPETGKRLPEPPPAVVPSVPDHPVTERPNARRDLLPDIEEINSTLRPGAEAREEEEFAAYAPAPQRRSFRTGFFSVMLVAAVLVIVYAMAPQLAARFPSMATTLTAYVATVDGLRVWLDGLMQSAAGGLRGLTGEG